MRQQIYIDRRSREVWREAREAALADNLSLAGVVALALTDWLEKRRRRIAREAAGHPACSFCGANPATLAALRVHQRSAHGGDS